MAKIQNFINSLNLDIFDKTYLVGYVCLWTYFIYFGMTYLTAGGIILILGAWLVYKGEIFVATFNYIIADLMWILNALDLGDSQGALFIAIGMGLGIAATYKMQLGKMAKNLKI